MTRLVSVIGPDGRRTWAIANPEAPASGPLGQSPPEPAPSLKSSAWDHALEILVGMALADLALIGILLARWLLQ